MKQPNFRKFMCKLLAFVLIFGQTSPLMTESSANVPSGYWGLLEDYVAARDSGNHQGTINAALQIEALYLPEADSTARTENLYNMYDNMAIAYEAMGDYKNALYYLEKRLEYAYIITNAGIRDFNDVIISTSKQIIQLDPMTEVYAVTQNLSQIPNYYQLYEPAAGAYFGRTQNGGNTAPLVEESAISFYIECLQQSIGQFDYLIGDYATGNRVIQICYNMPNHGSSVSQVLTEGANAQLIADMQYLGSLNAPIFLRIGGEMNDYKPDAEQYKNAFIKIANYARNYAPNVALVFSPNDISPWGLWSEDVMRYYPGDQYVDWVGLSSYSNLKSGLSNDMFYGAGDYSDPIHNLVEVVQTFGDRKPILISESGSAYQVDGQNLTSYAQSQLTKLFTYANMVFPQVKGIINFDYNPSGSAGDYYAMSSNSTLLSTYRDVISNNNTLLSSFYDKKTSAYVKAGTYQDSLSTLSLAAFCSPVGQPEMSVGYVLDGASIPSGQAMPYTCNIDVASLALGTHSLTVNFYGDNGFSDVKHYSITKNSGNSVVITESDSAVTPNTNPGTSPEVSEPEQAPEILPEVTPEPEFVPDEGFTNPNVPEDSSSNDGSVNLNRPATGEANINSYDDIAITAWYYQYLEPIVNSGIMLGYGNQYLPENNASRGMIAHALVNMSRETIPYGTTSNFTDVVGTGYEDIVAWCESESVMSGMGDGTFGVTSDVTREQFALVLLKFAQYRGYSTSLSGNADNILSSFPDGGTVSSWALTGVAWAVENNLMAGNETGICPQDSIKRSEVATMLHSFATNFG